MPPIAPGSSRGFAPRWSRYVEYVWAVGVLVLAGWFYLWTATSAGSPLTRTLQKDDLYNRLADGFLAGHLHFVEQPDAALAQLADPWDPAQNAPYAHFHDVSYFHGQYYLYFGPVPALLLLVPWKLVAGTYLGQNVAAAGFAWVGALMGIALILCLRRRHFPQLPGWVAGVCLTMAAFGNFVPVLLRRPLYYELAIASAYAFAMGAILLVTLAQTGGRLRHFYLALAGLAYGLVIGSRPNYLFGAAILAVPLLPALRDWWACADVRWREFRADAAAVGVPFLAVLCLLLLYNWMRFGQISEFGTSYMLAGLHPTRDVVTTFRFLPVNLWFYLFSRSQWIAFFPFFEVIHMPWFALPAGYIGEENVYGILPNLPFFWLLFWVWRLRRDATLTGAIALRDLTTLVLILVGLNALVICRISAAANRYMVDLLPPLIPLACVGVFWLESRAVGFRRRWSSRALWLGALAFTFCFNVFVSFQHNGLLQYYNPSGYRRLAHAFDRLSNALGATAPDRLGPLDLTVRFPTGRTGQLEPLLVTGLSFRADFIYVYYADEDHLQIGFEHTSYGGPLTNPPLAIDYAVPHALHLELGSLYPPVEDPIYDHMTPERLRAIKRTLRVTLDGKEVLGGTYDFYDSSPGDVSVGHNPVSDAFGSRFTGRILKRDRAGLSVRP